MTGWRIGWLVLPPETVRPIERLAQNLFISAPYISQIAAEAAFDCHAELQANVARYRWSRDHLLAELPSAGFNKPSAAEGAFYLLADIGDRSNDSAVDAGRGGGRPQPWRGFRPDPRQPFCQVQLLWLRGGYAGGHNATAVVALEVNQEMKIVSGRTWPESWLGDNPSWIRDGVFEFAPFHGGNGRHSFPSWHTSVIATAATLLWLLWPGQRILWATIVAMVVTGLVGGSYHFVSDIIGGLCFGVAIGLGSAG